MEERRPLPGEDGPLPMRHGGDPITADEALGVARRLARSVADSGRTGPASEVPDALPAPNAKRVPSLFRLPPQTLAFARARAEMEGVTMTQVVEEALDAYGRGVPGSRVTYTPPRR